MKKFLMGAALLMGVVLTQSTDASAQALKIGYFDLDQMVGLMPGTERIDSLLQTFVRDSVNPEYDFRVAEFNRTDSTLKADSAIMPAKVYQEKKTKLFQEFYLLQNWQEYSRQMYESKQQELLGPYYQKVIEAFRKVVDEGKYTYVFKGESLYHAPEADNLIFKVAAKLNIKVPAGAGDAPGN